MEVEILEATMAGYKEARVNKSMGVVNNVAIVRATSPNRHFSESIGRRYSRRALDTIARLLSGKKAYTDHVSAEVLQQSEGVRKIREVIGYYENGHVDANNTVRGDLYYLSNHAPWIEPLIERMSDKIGNSIHAFASDIVYDPNSKYEVVEDISSLESVDLVSEPGSTLNLFEARQDNRHVTDKDDEVRKIFLDLLDKRVGLDDAVKQLRAMGAIEQGDSVITIPGLLQLLRIRGFFPDEKRTQDIKREKEAKNMSRKTQIPHGLLTEMLEAGVSMNEGGLDSIEILYALNRDAGDRAVRKLIKEKKIIDVKKGKELDIYEKAIHTGVTGNYRISETFQEKPKAVKDLSSEEIEDFNRKMDYAVAR